MYGIWDFAHSALIFGSSKLVVNWQLLSCYTVVPCPEKSGNGELDVNHLKETEVLCLPWTTFRCCGFKNRVIITASVRSSESVWWPVPGLLLPVGRRWLSGWGDVSGRSHQAVCVGG